MVRRGDQPAHQPNRSSNCDPAGSVLLGSKSVNSSSDGGTFCQQRIPYPTFDLILHLAYLSLTFLVVRIVVDLLNLLSSLKLVLNFPRRSFLGQFYYLRQAPSLI